MRQVAHVALQHWPIDVTSIRLLQHSFNTTFRVDAKDGRCFALRINVNSRRTVDNLRAEAQWLHSLAQQPLSFDTPAPQATTAGQLFVTVPAPAVGRDVSAMLMSWLPGRDIGEEPPLARLQAVGRATAELHRHGAQWRPGDGADLPRYLDSLAGEPERLSSHELIPEGGAEVIAAVRRAADDAFDQLAGDGVQPTHTDLHGWNTKWNAGRLAVFDFDDSAWSVPALDLAVSAYYLRPYSAGEAALLDGYRAVAELPACSPSQFEALVAGRNLVLMNDLVVNSTAELTAMLPRYFRNSVVKLRHYLDHGEFRHDVPGLESG